MPPPLPWYQLFFTEAYWGLADWEYTPERTASEVAYLAATLGAHAGGRRVADLGCGQGRHAVELARRGFEVLGLDLSAVALGEAARRSAGVGGLTWRQSDLLADAEWSAEPLDAAVSIQSFGWGEEGEQLRFLRRVRRHLKPGGVLILDHSNPACILRSYQPEAEAVLGGVSYVFRRDYDPVSGRSRGTITARAADGTLTVLPHDIRLYTTAEVVRLLREAGFEVLRVDADFAEGRAVDVDTRYVQVVARARRAPPASLAVASHGAADVSGLDLRWAPDEIEWCRPTPAEVWEEGAGRGPSWEEARHYALDDPYHALAGAQTVAEHFGCRLEPSQVAFGAGVTALLHSLCGLADGGRVLASRVGYPDLPAWGRARGSEVRCFAERASAEEVCAEVEAVRPSLVILDRPSLMGTVWALPELSRIAAAGARVGAALVLDETTLSYLGPGESAVPLVNEFDNLLVLRSASKGYGGGGLRAGFAVSSRALGPVVREHLPPLQVSALSLGAALGLLRAGDIFGPLRRRVAAVKPEVAGLLERLSLEVVEGHPHLPWLVLGDEGGRARDALGGRDITGKTFTSCDGNRQGSWLRLSVPLSERRLGDFRAQMGV